MPAPTINEVHVNKPLTQMMVQYAQQLDAFVADKVFPFVPVEFRSDKFYIFPRDNWFKAGAVERAPGSETVGLNYHISTGDYMAKVYGVHMDLDDQTRANYDNVLQADASAMRFITRNLIITRELHWMQAFFRPGIWSGVNATGALTNSDFDVQVNGKGAWDTDTSDPMKDVRAISTYIESKTGLRPNKLVVTQDVYDALANNYQILDRIKYTQRGVITADLIASMLEVKQLLVAKAVINTAQDGKALNMGFMNSNKFLLTYAPDAPSLTEPSAGYIFGWTKYAGAGALGNTMSQFRMPWKKSDRFEGELCYDMKQVASDVAALGVNVLSNPGGQPAQAPAPAPAPAAGGN